jgi:4-hydroxy-tetrahydrodipicolinate synthase
MKNPFRGSIAALPTPFLDEDERPLDREAFKHLIELQIDGGGDGLVIAGTTGEAATLRRVERVALVRMAVETAAGRFPVLAGVGTNDTAASVELARDAAGAGANGLLAVAPYYNRPSQRGLVAHFGALAAATELPLVLYDIPQRTGISIEPETLARIARENPTVVALKAATVDEQRLRAFLDTGVEVLAGDDLAIPQARRLGAVGAIGVVAALAPRLTAELVRESERGGDTALAERAYERLAPLARALFLDTNPVPLKAALGMLGLANDVLRLPLVTLEEQHRPELQAALELVGLTTAPAPR